MEEGILHYHDTYYLAFKFMQHNSKAIDLLKKRFSLIFIDEMQDMAKYQYELLEKLFYEGVSSTIFQRIGDKNQAIDSSGDI